MFLCILIQNRLVNTDVDQDVIPRWVVRTPAGWSPVTRCQASKAQALRARRRVGSEWIVGRPRAATLIHVVR